MKKLMHNTKRLLACALIAVLALAALPVSVNADAADTKAGVIITTTGYVLNGLVCVDVNIANARANDVAAGRIDIRYNANVLSYNEEAEDDPIMGPALRNSTLVLNNNTSGKTVFTFCSSNGIRDGLMMTLQYDYRANYVGDLEFTVKLMDMSKTDTTTQIGATVYGCSVSVGNAQYAIAFIDGLDNAVIGTQTVNRGGSVTFPNPPVHQGYDFIGWSATGVNVVSDMFIYAQYRKTGTDVVSVSSRAYYADGYVCVDVSVANAKACRVGAGQVTAEYDTSKLNYVDCESMDAIAKSMFVLNDKVPGKIMFSFGGSREIKDGIMVTIRFEKRPNATGMVSFGLTDVEMIHVEDTTNMLPTATYNCSLSLDIVLHTVTFVDGVTNGVIDTQSVVSGEAAAAPDAPEHENYVFIGWDKAFGAVTSDLRVVALYEPYISGDVNGDNLINTGDAVSVLRSTVGLDVLTEAQKKAADYNNDGLVNTGDAVAILRHVVGLD